MAVFYVGAKAVVLVLLVLETTAWLGVIVLRPDLAAIPQVVMHHFVACLVQLVSIVQLSPLTRQFVLLDIIVQRRRRLQ